MKSTIRVSGQYGKRLFQAKTILLDNKAIYRPEPEETALKVSL